MEELLSLQKKYDISDKDMYILSKLDQNKVNDGFLEKTKSATKQDVILKKYRLTLSERQKVLKNLRFSTFHTNEEFVEKYKGAELDEELQAEGKKGINKLMVIIVVAVLFIVFANVFDNRNGNFKEGNYEYTENGVNATLLLSSISWDVPKEYDDYGVAVFGIRLNGTNNISKGKYYLKNDNVFFIWNYGVGPLEGKFLNEKLIISGPEGEATYNFKK